MSAEAPRRRHSNQHLIFDADDTLWESNRVFEEVVVEFALWLDHPVLDAEGVRRVHDEVALANVATHGYGRQAFAANLVETHRRLGDGRVGNRDLELKVDQLVERLSWKRLDLIAGVEETLGELRGRHRLLLLTKGQAAEQRQKIAVSGLSEMFEQIRIVPEKDVDTYRKLIAEIKLPAGSTWMIGNSPRSDVLAPLGAGLRSVYIHHPETWSLEHDDLPEDVRILRLKSFAELLDHF